MHLGRFGCIATELLSENPYRNPYRISGKKTSTASTGKTKHFLVVFGFFHGTKYVTISWKNPNFENCIAKFGCGSVRKFSEFFQNFQKKSSKNCKRYKKIFKNSIFFKNEAGYMYGLTYLFSRNMFLQFQFKKNIFLKFDQFSKSEWDSRDGDGDSQCDRHDEF